MFLLSAKFEIIVYLRFHGRHGGRLSRVEPEVSHAVQGASGSVYREIREERETGEVSEQSRPLEHFDGTERQRVSLPRSCRDNHAPRRRLLLVVRRQAEGDRQA